MKKYLLSWYGITDLRSGLGLEKSTGPVLGALLAEDYTNVIILGYTKNEKVTSKEETYNKLINLSDTTNPKETWALIDDYANTKDAHFMFKKWLSSQLQQNNKSTEVKLYSVVLDKLNDTEKIYTAVIDCLDMISADESEKEVTLYLSPGTPVMAFSWAFAALQNPALRVRIIAASSMVHPPETVSIPYRLLEWKGVQIPTSQKEEHLSNEFDTIFHLFGEQRMPSLFGILQFNSHKHVFINSKQYPAEVMKQFIGNSIFDEIAVNAFDPKNVEMKILQYIAENPTTGQVGFNLTGGTKLMYAGAMSVSKKINGTPFYFETKNNKMLFLDDFSSVDTKMINDVEIFIKLNSNELSISNSGKWNNDPKRNDPRRSQLTQVLWKKRSDIAKLYWDISSYDPGQTFSLSKKGITVSLDKDNFAAISIAGTTYEFEKWPDFAKYIAGGWLEEYTYTLLKPFVESGKIKDLRIGLEIAVKNNQKNSSGHGLNQLQNIFGSSYQELDVVFTDGKRLYIIECKAGSVQSEQIGKLQNIARYFGGVVGQGILASAFPPHQTAVKKRIKESSNVWAISGRNFSKELTSLVTQFIK